MVSIHFLESVNVLGHFAGCLTRVLLLKSRGRLDGDVTGDRGGELDCLVFGLELVWSQLTRGRRVTARERHTI